MLPCQTWLFCIKGYRHKQKTPGIGAQWGYAHLDSRYGWQQETRPSPMCYLDARGGSTLKGVDVEKNPRMGALGLCHLRWVWLTHCWNTTSLRVLFGSFYVKLCDRKEGDPSEKFDRSLSLLSHKSHQNRHGSIGSLGLSINVHSNHWPISYSFWTAISVKYGRIFPPPVYLMPLLRGSHWYGMVWYGIVGFNVPLGTVYVISETGVPEQWCASPIQ